VFFFLTFGSSSHQTFIFLSLSDKMLTILLDIIIFCLLQVSISLPPLIPPSISHPYPYLHDSTSEPTSLHIYITLSLTEEYLHDHRIVDIPPSPVLAPFCSVWAEPPCPPLVPSYIFPSNEYVEKDMSKYPSPKFPSTDIAVFASQSSNLFPLDTFTRSVSG